MDPRISHALVALGAVLATVLFYEVSAAFEEMARAVSADVPGAVLDEDQLARRDERARQRERDRIQAEKREIEERLIAAQEERGDNIRSADPIVSRDKKSPHRERLAEKAEKRGMSVSELREKRADRRGLSVEEHEARADARDEWREENGLQSKAERRAHRRERQRARDADEIAAIKGTRSTRRAIFDADPSLRDAADVMRKLHRIEGQFQEGDIQEPADPEADWE